MSSDFCQLKKQTPRSLRLKPEPRNFDHKVILLSNGLPDTIVHGPVEAVGLYAAQPASKPGG
jgi:hypothetical protein